MGKEKDFCYNTEYSSPLSDIVSQYPAEVQEYSGTLNQLLQELEHSLKTLKPSDQDKLNKALHPPRIIWGAVNYKIGKGDDNSRSEQLVREAIRIGLMTYRNDAKPQDITSFREFILKSGHGEALDVPVTQVSDAVTWEATDPARGQRCAEKLRDKCGYNKVLFIAQGQGGAAAGMDVYLRYQAMTFKPDSRFYVSRLSLYKVKDEAPQLNPRELDMLAKQAKGRSIVIFDEDVSSGNTMRTATTFFSEIFKGRGLITATNL